MTFSPDFYKNIYKIDTETLWQAIEGGITIALAASLYYSFFGYILGMSGLVGNVIKGKLSYEARRSFTIICGLIFSSSVVIYVYKHGHSTFYPFDSVVYGSNTHLIIAGFLVGFGTQLGSGCTSGHGLCGLPRLSLRSIGAVLIFLVTGIITATFNVSKLIPKVDQIEKLSLPSNINSVYYIAGTTLLPFIFFLLSNHKNFNRFFKTVIYFFIGTIFGFGLMLAGMSQRKKIFGFLELNKNWDPTLIFVLITGVLINLIIFTFMRKAMQILDYFRKKTIFHSEEGLSDPRGQIDWKLIIGSFMFGLGWGIGGLCPGPFLLLIPLNSLKIPLFWGLSFLLGMKLSQIINPKKKVVEQKQKKN